jgi:hypothetical protein
MSLSRRRFNLLSGAALGAGLLPRWTGRAHAQSSTAPMRFLAVRTPHGVDRDYWIPRPAGGGEPAADQALSELTFDYELSVLGAMMPWREQITVLDGLDTQVCKEATRADRRDYHGHNEQGALLTGAQPPADREGNYDNHPSLDFYLHARLGAPALLTAAVEGSGTWKCMSYDDAGRPRDPETDPRALFRQAFPADFMPPSGGMPAIDYSAGEQRILGYGQGALMRLRARLAGSERDKIDRHLDAVERLAAQAGSGSGMPPGMCAVSGMDVPMRDGSVGGVAGVEEVTRAHARVIAQAFACGRARVATLQILNDYPNYFTDLPDVRTPAILALYGDSFRFHENLVHDYWLASGQQRIDLRQGYLAGLRWSATHFAAVLEELDGLVDPLDPAGGSVLSNTIVFWHNEFGHDGHDNQETRHPAVIAGGGGRVLRLGRYLRLRNIQSDERVPHNRLLTSICQAMGLSDVDYFGDRDLTGRAEYQGPLTQIMV